MTKRKTVKDLNEDTLALTQKLNKIENVVTIFQILDSEIAENLKQKVDLINSVENISKIELM